MATPHVSWIMELMKSKSLGWMPSEIISAIVTTTDDTWSIAKDLIPDEYSYNTIEIYATGAEQVRLTKALDLDLMFGLTLNDYV